MGLPIDLTGFETAIHEWRDFIGSLLRPGNEIACVGKTLTISVKKRPVKMQVSKLRKRATQSQFGGPRNAPSCRKHPGNCGSLSQLDAFQCPTESSINRYCAPSTASYSRPSSNTTSASTKLTNHSSGLRRSSSS